MHSMKTAVSILLLVTGTALPGLCQEAPSGSFPPPPPSQEWRLDGPARTFNEADLFNYIDGGAELFLEFGFRTLRVQKYAHSETEITLDCYEMKDEGAALGIYLQRAGNETPLPGLTSRNTGDRYQVTVCKGRYFIQASNPSGETGCLSAMARLLNSFSENIPEEKIGTAIDLLPKKGRITGSERLIRGPYALQAIYTLGEEDILSLKGKAEAAAADYSLPGEESHTLILISYPDTDAAAAAFSYLIDNLDSYLTPVTVKKNSLELKDYKNRRGLILQTGDRIEIRLYLTAAKN